ncbi:MAG TPA: nickel pincer cofactor biosynthesis protein LarB [Dehalococcoidia bacterium]|nr:nickel pincer cofactor biosynthesis protein LarB [Dehalococcoidia bacterium]
MDEVRLRAALEDFKRDGISIDDLMSQLRDMPYEDLDFAKVDHHRAIRKGFPEVVFGQGKTPQQIASISAALLESSDTLLVTRASPAAFDAVKAGPGSDAHYDELACTIVVDRRTDHVPTPGVAVLCAGTADLPVANEAAVTAELMGCGVERINDVGVAGLHRLLGYLPILRKSTALVVVAGMEGALPSVVGGLVNTPIVAVPTSVGYGASFDGLAALLAMLNSCAPGVGVVNIDNGFGAGYLAATINMGASHD